MLMTRDGKYVAEMTCPICREAHTQTASAKVFADALDGTMQICPKCQPEADRRKAEQDRLDEIELAKKKALDDLAQRIEDSQLPKYELAFDPEYHGANVALASWMIRQLDSCMWVYGPTGRGKTRAIQNAARMAVRDRSVRYWPAYDLAARLTETSKHPESQLHDIYSADLLILDDLGVANLTESRLTSLVAIVDRRYSGWDQVRRTQGRDMPTFGWSSYGKRRTLGGQIWITSQVPPEELVRRLSTVSATDAAALVRRLADMCTVHEAEVIR